MIGKPNIITDAEMLALSLNGIEKYTKFSRLLFCGIQIHSYITIKKLQKHDTVSLKMQSHPKWEVPYIGVCVPPSLSCPTMFNPLSCVQSSCVCISFSDVKECIYLAIIVNLYEKD